MSKILIVDDEEYIRDFYKEEFGEEGYDVLSCSSCADVLRKIEEHNPDVVVLDIRLDDCDGLDLLQEIREAHSDLPVILSSAYDSHRDNTKSGAADDYVIKSFDLGELKSKVSKSIENSKNGKRMQC